VRNAVSESWSTGQTEGQIDRLKTLKQAMYGRAGTELLRAPHAAAESVSRTEIVTESIYCDNAWTPGNSRDFVQHDISVEPS
jgi:hypothetical protein